MVAQPAIVWLRDDLRIADNPALTAASELGVPVVVLYLLDEESPEVRPLGSASRWWLHESLVSLQNGLDKQGATLTLKRGAARTMIPELLRETGAGHLYWNRRYGPAKQIDAELKSTLRATGVDVRSFQANLLFEPWTVTTAQGTPFQVFTPFWRACLSRPTPRLPSPRPDVLHDAHTVGDALEEWGLQPTSPNWAVGFSHHWQPGEAGAAAALNRFVSGSLPHYHLRDQPAAPVTSRLSPHLRFGEISPFQVWNGLSGIDTSTAKDNRAKFASELGWREFNHGVLFHRPDLSRANIRPQFDRFPWRTPDRRELAAWQQGNTGEPLVDAGMRELWQTGTMHNRVRMVAASYLVKNLLVDWRVGEAWFWDTLLDADEASNPGNWQWVAGSGMDAAPYFRVFNPRLQAKKFDPSDEYVARWIPELFRADSPDVDPPEAGYPTEVAYPAPLVDLAESRNRALAAFKQLS